MSWTLVAYPPGTLEENLFKGWSKHTASGAEKKSPAHKMCGIQNDGDHFLKLFIKEFAHLGLILAHFDFGRLT